MEGFEDIFMKTFVTYFLLQLRFSALQQLGLLIHFGDKKIDNM